MPDPRAALALLPEATARLQGTLAGLSPAELATPSLLPGWSRGHVVAHLVLNAEALDGVVRGALAGTPVPMHPSQHVRDADIDAHATDATHLLRHRLETAAASLDEALVELVSVAEPGSFSRTPGAPGVPVARIPLMRLREVEIHHADLGLGYTADEWPAEVAELLLEAEVAAYEGIHPFRVHATDLDRSWDLGENGPTVAGPSGTLAWWLSGRPAHGLSCSAGELPRIEAR